MPELELLRAMGHPVRDARGRQRRDPRGAERRAAVAARARDGLVVEGRPADRRAAARPVPWTSSTSTTRSRCCRHRSTGAAGASGAAVVQTIHNYRPICPAATLFRDGQPCEDCVGRRVAWPSVLHGCYRGSRIQTAPIAAMLATQRLAGAWRNVDAVIALTEFAASKLAEGGLPVERIHVKPNFVADPGERGGSGTGFLFVGRLAPEKGIGTLIDAAPLLEPGIEIRLAGDGPEDDRLRAAAIRYPALRPLGRLERAGVQAEMAASLAVVFPSLWYEGMPMTVLEAFAAGVPVIAARRGAAAVMIEDGVTGLTFEPGDAAGLAAGLAWAQAHPTEMAAFGRAARQRFLAAYTAEASHRRLLEIYDVALARAARRATAA